MYCIGEQTFVLKKLDSLVEKMGKGRLNTNNQILANNIPGYILFGKQPMFSNLIYTYIFMKIYVNYLTDPGKSGGASRSRVCHQRGYPV